MRKSGVKHTTLTKNYMRKIIVIEFITIDGVMQAPGGPEEDTSGDFKYGGWTIPYFDEFAGKENYMPNKIGHEASIPNPALKPLSVLIGTWKTIGTHPYVLNTTFHGHTSFEWLEGGAFLIMHSEIDEPDIPSGIAIFGSDDATGEYFMIYFDERKVSRKYQFSFNDNVLKWWRNTPDFSQRFTATIIDDGRTIIGKGEMSKKGKSWERDLDLTYTRVK